MTPDEMDAAAIAAGEDLKTLDKNAVDIVTAWWNKHYLKAGHKRLGRVLLSSKPKPEVS